MTSDKIGQISTTILSVVIVTVKDLIPGVNGKICDNIVFGSICVSSMSRVNFFNFGKPCNKANEFLKRITKMLREKVRKLYKRTP